MSDFALFQLFQQNNLFYSIAILLPYNEPRESKSLDYSDFLKMFGDETRERLQSYKSPNTDRGPCLIFLLVTEVRSDLDNKKQR